MSTILAAVLQVDDSAPGGGAGGMMVVLLTGVMILVSLVLALAGQAIMFWKVFEKAGEPGWASLVPIYNLFVLVKISGRELWWMLLVIIPCVNFVTVPMLCIDIARKFGKDTLYGIGLAFVGIIFFPMLGFGSAQYNRNA